MRAPDYAARERALDPRSSFIVTAPAGSGKTALLAARYFELLAHGGPDGGPCHPRRILAVTFTDKAAVEMRERIALWLRRAKDEAYEPGTSDWDRQLLTLARSALKAFGENPATLENPASLRMSTFHSLCASIAGRWPAQAEVPPGAAVLPDQRQEEFIRGAVREAVDEAASRHQEDSLRRALEGRLAALNGNVPDLSQKLVALLKGRHRLGDAWAFLERGDLAGAERAIIGRLTEHVKAALGPAREHFLRNAAAWRNLSEALAANPDAKAKRLPEEIPECGPNCVAEWVLIAGVFLSQGNVRKQFQSRWGYPKQFPASCQNFIRSCPPEAAEALARFQGLDLDEADPAGLASLFSYLQLAASAMEKLKPRIPGEGLDYLELESAALRALEKFDRPSEGLIFFHETLRHVLVDEAQDLNPEQARLLGRLLEGWEPDESERPRTIFVVGDPKQSIYRFRGSEVSLFTRMITDGIPRPGEGPFRFLTVGGGSGIVRLAANFRSHPAVVHFCNGLFEPILSLQPRDDWDEVAFEASAPGLPATPEYPSIRLALFPKDQEDGEGPARLAEARWLAFEVDRLRRERPGESVAILIPRRTKLGVLAAAFAEAGVPVRMLEGEALQQKPEVLHLHTLFRALASPCDDVAWAGALRAPWCRVSDRTLCDLARATGKVSARKAAWGLWKRAILESPIPEVAALCEKLREVLENFGREAYDVTLSRAWEALGGPRSVAAQYGASGVANCLRYLEIVRDVADRPPHEALAASERLLEKAYTPAAPEATNSAVCLMTIHKAKGLEFDHVFIPQLDYDPLRKNRRERPPFLMLTLPVAGRPLFVAVEGDRRTGLSNLSYEILKRLDEGREMAETKRLLYVAATRARRGLHMSGTVKPPQGEASFAASKNSPLALLMDSLLAEGKMKEAFSTLGAELLVSAKCDEPQAPGEKAPSPSPPAPVPFEPVQLPYIVRSPSEKLDSEEGSAPRSGEDEVYAGGETPRISGVVIHRILETLARGGSLPHPASVAGALTTEGLASAEAKGLAESLIEQARTAWEDPGFSALRSGAELLPEWPVEQSEGNDLWVGRLDLVIEKDTEVVVLDYKTSRPAPTEDLNAFKLSLRDHYARQLTRYAGMLAEHPRFSGKSVRSFLLLTAFPGERLAEVQK